MINEITNQLLGLAEIGSNKLLGMDPEVLKHCETLQGHIIAIQISDLDKTLYCHPGSWGIRFSLQLPAKEVYATIRGRLSGLVSLSLNKDKLSTSIQQRIEIIGNPAVAQRFQKILTELDIDWEQELSKYTGDIVAFRVGQGIRKTRQAMLDIFDSVTLSGREYLQEESHHLPTMPEFQHFQQQVTDIRHDVERLEAMIDQLIRNKNKPAK